MEGIRRGVIYNYSEHPTLLYNVKISHVDQYSYNIIRIYPHQFIIYPKHPINA